MEGKFNLPSQHPQYFSAGFESVPTRLTPSTRYLNQAASPRFDLQHFFLAQLFALMHVPVIYRSRPKIPAKSTIMFDSWQMLSSIIESMELFDGICDQSECGRLSERQTRAQVYVRLTLLSQAWNNCHVLISNNDCSKFWTRLSLLLYMPSAKRYY